jgi:hypothetical protein
MLRFSVSRNAVPVGSMGETTLRLSVVASTISRGDDRHKAAYG